jgi:hydroxyacylglutathione hydrolase
MIQVKKFYAFNDLRNYSYLIFDDHSGSSWIIDPYEASTLIDYIRKNSLEPRGILNTHHHFDHIRGNDELVSTFGCPIKKVREGEKITLDNFYELETIDSPGHTMDHQVFTLKQRDKILALFSGDTLFNAGVGNCKGGGDVDVLYETVQRLLMMLPPETILYPGHDYLERNLLFAETLEHENPAIREELKRARAFEAQNREELTLAEEMKYNPFFRLDSEEIRESLGKARNSVAEVESDKRDLFRQIRKLRDIW